MDKIEAGEANMDAKMLDGREVVAELVREARADAAEDRFLTNRANMDMADRVISTKPSTASCRSASRTGPRLSPNFWAISASTSFS